jgi:predicted DNA-binding protein (MmcQ/YjbR family)
LPGAVYDNIKGSVSVDGIIFAVFAKNSVTLSCDSFAGADLLRLYPSIKHDTLYIVPLDGSVPESEVMWMIKHSYDLVKKEI